MAWEREPLGLCCIVIEASQVLQTGPVAELVLVLEGRQNRSVRGRDWSRGRLRLRGRTRENNHNSGNAHLCLNGGWSLGAQHLDSLENVHHALVPHPLQHDAEGDEHTGPSYSSAVGGQMGRCLEVDTTRFVARIVICQKVNSHLVFTSVTRPEKKLWCRKKT